MKKLSAVMLGVTIAGFAVACQTDKPTVVSPEDGELKLLAEDVAGEVGDPTPPQSRTSR